MPPRFVKQKEQRDRDSDTSQGFDMKVDNWDNDLANNIPAIGIGEMSATIIEGDTSNMEIDNRQGIY